MSNLLWHVWNFDIELHEDNLEYPFSRITRFHRVRTLKLQEIIIIKTLKRSYAKNTKEIIC